MTAAESGDMTEPAARLSGPPVARTAAAPVPAVRNTAAAARDASAAVTDLYAAHYRSLVGVAALLLRDQAVAEQVVQDAFVAMHTGWRRVRDSDKALSYLRRSVIDGSRSALAHGAVAGRTPTLPEHAAMVDALDRLPLRQREALVLRFYADMSPAQIASAMGISPGAVEGHTARALSSLRSLLEARA
ncbi:MAG TPA: sigma-70 family RNA polymerase sigma factor [Streptosporangiaceae bacterium]|nr:sigma-70 family RNA polymerase sigma factor [Streptosporangiaceae bacterium]